MPESVLTMMEQSDRLSAESDGAFDVTVAPLLKLWGFHGDPQLQTCLTRSCSTRPWPRSASSICTSTMVSCARMYR
ncbi:FAD:protein FMN transferase [Halopseudomonas pachastrellae]|nr:FAD:protein FMN transferase [Halopseudomonas pachastrellae]